MLENNLSQQPQFKAKNKLSHFGYLTIFIVVAVAAGAVIYQASAKKNDFNWPTTKIQKSREVNEKYLSPFGAMDAGVVYVPIKRGGTASFKEAAEMGVKWNRSAINDFTGEEEHDYDLSIIDRNFLSANDAGIPNYVFNIHIAGQARGEHQWTPATELASAYSSWLKYVVERYDGDGINDLPGLKYPIKYWQIDNEPDGYPQTGDAASYADLLKMSYEAIKIADPEARVLCGGFSKNSDFFESVFDRYLPDRYFDIFDYHWYGKATGDYRLIEKGTKKIRLSLARRNWPEAEIWTTEMGSYSGQPIDSSDFFPFQSEAQQAGDYVKRWVHSISIDIKVIFGSIKEGFAVIPSDEYHDHTGLIYDGVDGNGNKDPNDRGNNVKKIGYYSYQIMSEKLEGLIFQEMTELTNDTFAYRFLNVSSGKPTYVVWWDGYKEGTSKPATLSGINEGKIKITDAITDFNGQINFWNDETINGQINLTLKAYHPLFIEVE